MADLRPAYQEWKNTRREMQSRLRRLKFSKATAPLALLVLCLVVFGPLVYRLGFYWDDWPSIWFYHLGGPTSYFESFSSDRPALAWMFLLTSALFEESTVAWQWFSLAARWLAGLALWWTLCGLWPRHTAQAFWVAALFLIYPGFSQQYIAVTYSNAFLVFTLFLFSLGSMVWAQRKPGWFWPLTILALATQLASMSMTEYFYGLELLRPAILWLLLVQNGERKSTRLLQVVRSWLPYLVVAGAFLIDRIFFYQTPRGQILLLDQLQSSPFLTLSRLGLTILIDFIEVNFAAWIYGLDPSFLRQLEPVYIGMMMIVMIASALLAIFYFSKQTNHDQLEPAGPTSQEQIRKWGLQAVSLGIYAFLVSGWVVWATNQHIELVFPWDRFMLVTLLGTSLLIAGLAALITRTRRQSAILLGLLIGLSAGVQLQYRLAYRQEWLAQRNFLWQLAWRAPGIEPGTTLVTSELPFRYFSDNSLTAPLNWTYAPKNQTPRMSYLLYDLEARLGVIGASIDKGAPIVTNYRAASFTGSTDQALVLFYDPPRCLKIIDPVVDRYLPVKPLFLPQAMPLSRLELIQSGVEGAAKPPEHILGPEPPHKWCYYFEKAELYGQMGDWQKAAEMADRALKINKHLTGKNVSEWLPFIEAYGHTGEWEKAVSHSLQAYQFWNKTQYPLCDVWLRILASTPPAQESQAAFEVIQKNLNCRAP
jgi:tetratricopeptide (TPR) repeat protein